MQNIIINKQTRTTCASLEEVRNVWGIVSERPAIPVREIACKLGLSITRAHYILKFLEQKKYIKQRKQKTGRTILVPLVTLQRQP